MEPRAGSINPVLTPPCPTHLRLARFMAMCFPLLRLHPDTKFTSSKENDVWDRDLAENCGQCSKINVTRTQCLFFCCIGSYPILSDYLSIWTWWLFITISAAFSRGKNDIESCTGEMITNRVDTDSRPKTKMLWYEISRHLSDLIGSSYLLKTYPLGHPLLSASLLFHLGYSVVSPQSC